MGSPQAKAFLDGEGDRWLERNREKLPPARDPVLTSLQLMNIKPIRVLEIGCSNGWRLNALHQAFGCSCTGVDPSEVALVQAEHNYPHMKFRRGTAAATNLHGSFDLIVYGFCLYVCDPSDYMRIACEGDRLLSDQGHIVIYDFHSPTPRANVYHHKPELHSYKMDWRRLFIGHPAYRDLYSRSFCEGGSWEPDNMLQVSIIKKDMAGAFA